MNYLPAIAVGSMILLLSGLASSADKQAEDKLHDPRLSGGKTTVFDTSHNAFSLPANNLGIMRRDSFFIGNAFFKQPWVSSPASTTARDGLGPVFNANTCQGCHVKDGRGQPPITKDDKFITALVRLSIPAVSDEQKAIAKKHGVVPEPNYGDQLQPRGVPGVKGEGTPRLRYSEIKGTFNDGTPYSLVKPEVYFEDLQYGDLHNAVMTSIRIAPAMIGLGLLEAIPEKDLLAHADPDDSNKDGISGRPNTVWDIKQEKPVVGRFDWKANQPTIEQQSAGAFHGDMGLTSTLFPKQNCTDTQKDCQQAPDGGKPEVPDNILEKVVFYASTLAVPARRDVNDETVLKGERLFASAGCTSCHITTFTTGKSEQFPELSHQTIHPYTDLLLHDMGEGLADNRPDFDATGSEWRTAPLWGIGLVKHINGHTRFLHDGRARNLMEAVLWHGGEGEAAKQAVLAMDKNERDALVTFLQSL